MSNALKYLTLVAFLACIPTANWLIGHVGTKCLPNGPCLIPVAPGIMAPSGVLMIGLALVLRDLAQRAVGIAPVIAAIFLGAGLSVAVAPPALALASGLAFLLSELADTAVYTPLRRRNLVLAVAASSAVGLIVDSALFLWIAFGSLQYVEGQIIGKAVMVVLTLPILALLKPA
jgi:uncharacterized PurR-regulated membrane protein YhhQ (DUF165 family)